NPVGVIGAKSGERAATVRDIGDQEGFAVMGHGPDVTFRLQAARPAFQLSAAVDARRHAADRFLMDALDGGRVARCRPAKTKSPRPAPRLIVNRGRRRDARGPRPPRPWPDSSDGYARR